MSKAAAPKQRLARLRMTTSDLRLLGDLERVIDLDTEVPHRRLELRVPEQQLHRPKVLGAPIDQCRLRPSHGVRSVVSAVQPQFVDPVPKDPGVLARAQMRRVVKPAGEQEVLRLQPWAIRVRLQMEHRAKDLALFNLGFDSELRGCDLVALRVRDVYHGSQVANRATVMQQKTHRPVQFEITPVTRDSLEAWIRTANLRSEDYLFPSRMHASQHIGTRQCARILHGWVSDIGLDPTEYGTHSMRRSKASMIYKKTKNLRAVQILLGHSKLESTVRSFAVETKVRNGPANSGLSSCAS